MWDTSSLITHQDILLIGHQKGIASIERDENFVPATRSEYIRSHTSTIKTDYTDMLEETPLYTLYSMFIMQILYVFNNLCDSVLALILQRGFFMYLLYLHFSAFSRLC